MKAVVVPRTGGAEVLSYRDVPDPVPADDEILIRVSASALNFADILVREGTYHAGSPPPLVPGMDVSGTIEAVGLGAADTGLEVGQRVAATMGEGGYAELVAARVGLVWPLPEGIDFEAGAAFPTAGITAYNVLTLAGRLAPGETVLIHSAAGGVGTTIAQIARMLGAGLVIGTVGTVAKARVAREAGCDEVLVRDQDDFAERVNELTDNRGADVIADPVAGETLERGIGCLAPFGRLRRLRDRLECARPDSLERAPPDEPCRRRLQHRPLSALAARRSATGRAGGARPPSARADPADHRSQVPTRAGSCGTAGARERLKHGQDPPAGGRRVRLVSSASV